MNKYFLVYQPKKGELLVEEITLEQYRNEDCFTERGLSKKQFAVVKAKENESFLAIEAGFYQGDFYTSVWAFGVNDQEFRRYVYYGADETQFYNIRAEKMEFPKWENLVPTSQEEAISIISYGMGTVMQNSNSYSTDKFLCDEVMAHMQAVAEEWNIPFSPAIIQAFANDYAGMWNASSMFC